jgi:predicted nuclease of predicted toxin-antitoxin system
MTLWVGPPFNFIGGYRDFGGRFCFILKPTLVILTETHDVRNQNSTALILTAVKIIKSHLLQNAL